MSRQVFLLAVGILVLIELPSLRYVAGQEDRRAVDVAQEAEEVAEAVVDVAEEAVELAEADPEQPAVSIDIAIVEYLVGEGTQIKDIDSLSSMEQWVESLDDRQLLLSLTRVTVSTVDGEQGMAQYGERAAVETGRTRVARPRGRADVDVEVGDEADARRRALEAFAARNVAVSYNYEELGTLVRATPRVTQDGLVVEVQIERSAVSALRHPAELDPDAAGQVPPPTIVQLSAKSTLRLRDGKTRLAYRKSATSPHGLVETVVFVTAQVERSSAETPSQRRSNRQP